MGTKGGGVLGIVKNHKISPALLIDAPLCTPPQFGIQTDVSCLPGHRRWVIKGLN
jgi:hypothetical protein